MNARVTSGLVECLLQLFLERPDQAHESLVDLCFGDP